ncbi:hypothetical protein BD410DRAFT_560778 [Rickenella mellea]|uniref:Glucose receptor Git3 N-terminal domain-containing protein n=1 Tax=Rickenella mellea TaxID=50990 RepID=A0A4Y7QFM6_9AGAM|nr:hypothetical protein BD410DRAFT_560778 [Rickenella mellea]
MSTPTNLDCLDNCELTRGDSIGLAFVSQASLISCIAVITLFFLIIRNVLRYRKNKKLRLIQEPLDVYMLSLFISDLLQAIGNGMGAKWAHDGIVRTGGYCTAQGVIEQGTHSRTIAICVVALIWIYIIVFVATEIGINGGTDYITATPYWCWVSWRFGKARVWGEYVWLWITLGVSTGLYVPLFLWNRGNLAVDSKYWWKVEVHLHPRSESEYDDEKGKSFRKRPGLPSLAILAYPLIYCILVLPLSVVRWITFHHHQLPPAATFAVIFLFSLSGAANVILLLSTRPNLLLFGERMEDMGGGDGRAPSPSLAGSYGPNGRRESQDLEMAQSGGARTRVMSNGRLNDSSESGWDMPAVNADARA